MAQASGNDTTASMSTINEQVRAFFAEWSQYVAGKECTYEECASRAVNAPMVELIVMLRVMQRVGDLVSVCKAALFYGKDVDPIEWINAVDHVQSMLRDARDVSYAVSKRKSRGGAARATERFVEWGESDWRLLHGLLGMVSEAGGEIAPHAIDVLLNSYAWRTNGAKRANFEVERGDYKFFEALVDAATHDDPTLPYLATIAKLNARYKAKFTAHEAINRDTSVEDQAAEQAIPSRFLKRE